jgi:hypothetical protein
VDLFLMKAFCDGAARLLITSKFIKCSSIIASNIFENTDDRAIGLLFLLCWPFLCKDDFG